MSEASDQEDARIAELLAERDPPARDAMFRLSVLERRERKRFQRKTFALLALGIATVTALTVGVASGADLGGVVIVLSIVAAVAASWFISAPAVLHLIQLMLRGAASQRN